MLPNEPRSAHGAQSGLSFRGKLLEQCAELRRATAAHQDAAAAALLGQAAHAPDRCVAIHISDDDDDVATLHERAQRRGAPTREVPVVVLEAMSRALREVFIEALVAIEAADDTDVHGNSKGLSAP